MQSLLKKVCHRSLGLLAVTCALSACGGGSSSKTGIGGTPPPNPTTLPTASPTVTPEPTTTPTTIPTTTPTTIPTATPTTIPTATPTTIPTTTPTITPTPTTTPTTTPIPNAVRLANTSCLPPPPTVQPGAVTTVPAFANLPAIDFPLALVQASAQAGGFWYAADRSGRVYTFENQGDTAELSNALDIRSQVATNGEFGLTGMALHPNYPSDNRIFLLYNAANSEDRSTLSAFTVNTANRSISAASETVILTLDQLSPFHNGGDLAFGNDGYLYASFGDGEIGNGDVAQDLRNLYGSIVRIDVNSGSPYGIPASNPNAGETRCNSSANANGQNCPEIFAYGFRNPWRFSIDSQTGEVWVGDVGDDEREEVSRLSLGGNFGWPLMEGSICGPSYPNCDQTGLIRPIADYPSSGSSVVGGYVYRGTQSPTLSGQYIFGDIYSRQFYSLPANASVDSNEAALFVASPGGAAMAQGNDGEIYILAGGEGPGSNFHRITAGGGVSVSMAENLSDTGCFDVNAKRSVDGVFDYSLIAPLWSDGAAKRRAFAIPDGSEIQVLADGDFEFPTDSILIKHFLNGSTFIETRLMVNHSNGWAGYSYEWNDAQTQAQLLSEGKRKDVGEFVHIYPSREECQACHTEAANNSLGLELAQLNTFDAELNANMVDYLSAAGYLASEHSSTSSRKLFALDDESASLAQRARSYLHSNCANCHRPGGPAAEIDLRYTTAFADTQTCDVDPQRGNLGVSGAKIIAPNNPDASVLVLRMEASEASGNRMPRISSLLVDQDAVALIRQWIADMDGCP